MLKVMMEETLISEINSSPGYKLTITDRLVSNMILYTVIQSRNDEVPKFLVYRRPHKDSVYHDRWSIGFGGSMELVDIKSTDGIVDKYGSLLNAGVREINEEIRLSEGTVSSEEISLLGYIDGHHKAIVGHLTLPRHVDAAVIEPENEGKGWFSIDQLVVHLDQFEPWSQSVIEGLAYLLGDVSNESSQRISWRKVPGYSQYEINTRGELRNLKTGRISKGGDAGRYLKVSVYPDGASEPHLEYLHILVCKTYHGAGTKGQVVLHNNNIRTDVRPANLKWGTQSDNIQSAYDDGLIKK